MIINTKQIKELILNTAISAYSIEAETGITRSTITEYRKGSADFENMSLSIAIKLQEYINRKEEENMKHLVLEHSGYNIHQEEFENYKEALDYATQAFNRLTRSELKTHYIEVVRNYEEDEYSPGSFNINYDPVKTFKDDSYQDLK